MRLEGSFAHFQIVFHRVDDTVNPETQPLGEVKLVPRSISPGVLD
jgi:hypothetical protein